MLGALPTSSPQPSDKELVAVGDVMVDYLQRLPFSLNLHVNKAECVAKLDKKTRYMLHLLYRFKPIVKLV